MKKFFLSALPALLAGAILVAGAAGCAQQSTDHVHAPSATETESKADKKAPDNNNAAENRSEKVVVIQDGQFDPMELKAEAGDIVTWLNKDSQPHEIHADDDAFASPTLELGESFSRTFDGAGEFDYHDHLHKEAKGEIIVE